MARSNSPRAAARRGVLDFLAAAKRNISFTQNLWNVRGTVYQPVPGNPSAMGRWIDRPADAYPENRTDHWEHLIRQLDDLAQGVATMREFAVNELADVRAEQQGK